ncbi:unnamed protein product [Discosporangium mesarthrocarpum]
MAGSKEDEYDYLFKGGNKLATCLHFSLHAALLLAGCCHWCILPPWWPNSVRNACLPSILPPPFFAAAHNVLCVGWGGDAAYSAWVGTCFCLCFCFPLKSLFSLKHRVCFLLFFFLSTAF